MKKIIAALILTACASMAQADYLPYGGYQGGCPSGRCQQQCGYPGGYLQAPQGPQGPQTPYQGQYQQYPQGQVQQFPQGPYQQQQGRGYLEQGQKYLEQGRKYFDGQKYEGQNENAPPSSNFPGFSSSSREMPSAQPQQFNRPAQPQGYQGPSSQSNVPPAGSNY